MPDEILITIAKNTRRYRLKKGLTQAKLAKKAKMHPTYISKIENAKINMFLPTLFKLSKGLGISAKYLVK